MRWLVVAVAACAFGAAQADPDVTMTHPPGGWTYSGISDDPGRVSYAYPSNLIERGGQRQRTLIEGRLKQIGSARRTPTMVVNGNAMPLYTGDDGRFARPYAFGPGSNGIEIRDAAGPEMFSTTAPMADVYHVVVNYWGNLMRKIGDLMLVRSVRRG